MTSKAAVVLGVLCAAVAAPPKPAQWQIKVPVWADGDALDPRDLRARLEGASSRVLAVRGPADDLMILVALDLSGDLSLAEFAKSALCTEVEKLPARTTVGLLHAHDGLKVLSDPTADRGAVIGAIRELPVSGKSGLLDTIETAARLGDSILTKTNVRLAVLYVTDSDIGNYREDYTNPVINRSDSHDLSRRFPESLIQEKISRLDATLSRLQTPLFIVHLRYRSDRLNEAYQNGLKALAETTGAGALFCRSSAEIPEAIERSLHLIASHYSVTLALPERASRNVQVHLDAGASRSMSYRTRFVLKGR